MLYWMVLWEMLILVVNFPCLGLGNLSTVPPLVTLGCIARPVKKLNTSKESTLVTDTLISSETQMKKFGFHSGMV